MRDSSYGRSSFDVRRSGPSALVERDGVLASLRRSLERARAGRRGTVLICGSAGLGKTSVVEGFLGELLNNSEVWVARGECVEHYGVGEAYLPVLDALGRLGRLLGAPLTSTLERHAPLWLQQLPGLTDVETQKALSARLQHAAPARMLRELTYALEILSSERTLVFSFEDLHWCDPSTCSLLMFLARRREPARLLVIGTLRADEAPDHVKNLVRELSVHGWSKELTVSPLSEEGVRQYLHARLHAAPEDSLVKSLHARTGGNALFVSQCLEALLDEDMLENQSGRFALREQRAGRADPLPKSLQGLALRRVDALTPSLRALVEVASVAGHELSSAELAGPLDLTLDAVELRCAELARDTGLIESTGVNEWPDGTLSATYRFAHALLHEAIYEGLDEVRRVRLHRQIGERLEQAWGARASEIAPALRRHFEAGRDPSRALKHAEQAAQVAMMRHAAHETIAHLEAALTLLPAAGNDPARELALRTRLGSALIAGRGWTAPEVLANYTRAHALCRQLRDTRALGPVLRGLAACHQVRGELGLARVHADALLDRCAEESRTARVQAHAAQIGLLIAQADYVRALHHASEALQHYHREDSFEHAQRFGGLDPALSALSWAGIALWSLGFFEAAVEVADLSLALSCRLEHPFSTVFARHMVAVLWQRLGREDEASALLQSASELAERAGYPFLSILTRASWVSMRVGSEDAAAALVQLKQLVHAHEHSGVRFALPDMLGLLAGVEMNAGARDEAAHTLERAVALCEETGQTSHLPALYIQSAELWLSNDDGARARKELRLAQDIARGQHALAWELRAVTRLSELAQADRTETQVLLREVYAAFDEGFDRPDLQRAAGILGDPQGSATTSLASPRRGLIARAFEDITMRALALCGERPSTVPRAPMSETLPSSEQPPPRAESQRVVGKEPQDGALQRLVREGEYWTIAYEQRLCRIKDARGMGYLAQLMAAPHREVHVLDLASEPLPDDTAPEEAQMLSRALGRAAGTDGVDERARAAYRTRARELEQELEEARAHADLGRIEALEREHDMLEQELSRAFGLGGRARSTGAPSERARINVTRAIKSAIRRISEHHPELGYHLSAAIRTGTFCVYAPDPTRVGAWHVEATIGAA